MSGVRRVAILGGTFDPIHYGHLAIAEQARERLGADEAWLVPTRRPPHREPTIASAEDRLDMVTAAVDGRAGLRSVDLEVRRPGPSYTIDTLVELEAQHPDAELWLVLGADAARDIGSWHRHDELLARARFLLVNRTGVPDIDDAQARSLGYPAERTRIVHVDSPPLSATEARRRVAAGLGLEGLVPAPVASLIAARGLYAGGPHGIIDGG